jgi:hypothetical protein
MATLVINEGKAFIEDIWDIDDIREVASGFEEDFTDEMLMSAMSHVVENYDANYGITWETVESALQFELVVQEQRNA